MFLYIFEHFGFEEALRTLQSCLFWSVSYPLQSAASQVCLIKFQYMEINLVFHSTMKHNKADNMIKKSTFLI